MIKIKSLMKRFDDNHLFSNLNMTISSGEMVAIIGASGSGKSTLLNILGSLESYEGVKW